MLFNLYEFKIFILKSIKLIMDFTILLVVLKLKLISEEDAKIIKDFLKQMESEVKILLFSQRFKCTGCREAENLVDDLLEISDKLKVEKYISEDSKEVFHKYDIIYVPTFIVVSHKNPDGIRFLGVPLGYEFTSFLEDLVNASKPIPDLPQNIIDDLLSIERNVHLKVFVTLSCPYCPIAVKFAHAFAMVNPKIRAEMIDAALYPQLALKYSVSAVPKTVINDRFEVLGAIPPNLLLDKIKEAVK